MKPILFNTEMVRAILDGRKTVTRRVIKPQPKGMLAYCCMGCGNGKWSYPGEDAWKYWKNEAYKLPKNLTDDDLKRLWTPPCNTDDILYVRETWQYAYDLDGNGREIEATGRYLYAADDNNPNYSYWVMPDGTHRDSMPWRPSIHMPREAARIFLRVTNVRVERLNDIENNNEEAKREGFDWKYIDDDFSVQIPPWVHFAVCWDDTIKKSHLDKYGWDANPWVWVIEFERISREDVQHD